MKIISSIMSESLRFSYVCYFLRPKYYYSYNSLTKACVCLNILSQSLFIINKSFNKNALNRSSITLVVIRCNMINICLYLLTLMYFWCFSRYCYYSGHNTIKYCPDHFNPFRCHIRAPRETHAKNYIGYYL